MTRTTWILTAAVVAVCFVPSCKKRTERAEKVVDIIELREGGVLTRFEVAPTEDAMLWLDKGHTTGIVWDATLRAEVSVEVPAGRAQPASAPTGDPVAPPVVRTVLDWRWDGPVLRVNGAVAGARLPAASTDDVATARVLYHEAGCPSEASLASVVDGVRFPGKVLVVDDCAWTRQLFQQVAPRFRGLVLRGGAFPADAFEGLNHARWTPSLLYIEGIRLEARMLPDLAPFSGGLVSVSLRDTAIPFEEGSIDVLTALFDLRFLDLSGTGIRDEDLSRLVAHGPALDELRLSQTWLSAARLDKVSRMWSLRALDLSNTRADAGTLGRFGDLKRLRRLDLRATAVEDPGIAELTGLTGLMELDAPFWLTDASAPDLAKLTGLRVLRARAVRFRDQGLKHLGALEALLFLELSHVNVTDAGVAGLLPAPSLEVLEVEHCPLGDPGMEVLTRMPRLRKIEIEETNVTDAGFATLARAPALEVLKAQELPGITDAGMEFVPAFPKLIALVLDEAELTDAAVPHLAKATGLRLLSLETTGISTAGRERLWEALPAAIFR
ncbi:MAG: hypothetical protein ABIK09_10305 [Pseudomonadota bacterium]